MLILLVIEILLLGFIAFQDIKDKQVHVALFLLLGIVFITHNIVFGMHASFFRHTAINLGFLLLETGLLFMYVWFRKRTARHFLSLLGLGDIVFFVLLALLLSPLNFIAFFMGTLMLVILFYGIRHFLFANADNRIPLAGIQAALMAALLVADYFWKAFNVYSDTLLLNTILA